ncbi:MAG: CvpA family protein [Alistipes sp.]|nr:CvpA family protein [Alistipes sp.]
MIIDIILLVVAIFALVMGWRRGFIVQLCQLIGLYFAILIAPEFAGEVGAAFSNDLGVAYLLGFAIIIVGAWLLIWIIAPLLRKMLFWEFLRKLDSILGLALAFVTFLIITSVGCSVFSTANIGEVRAEKILELGASGLSAEEFEEYAERINSKDLSMLDCFESKYVDFETLDSSILFYPMVSLGDALCPGLEDFKEDMVELAVNLASTDERK